MSLIPWRNKQRQDGGTRGNALSALRTEMDRLFDTFVREPWGTIDWPFGADRPWSPVVDVSETAEEVTVRAEIPGMDPKDLEVTVTGNQLVLAGEKKETTETKEKSCHVSESRYGTFRRTIPLPANVDAENVEAECAHGILSIRLKKTQAAPAKRIEVKTK